MAVCNCSRPRSFTSVAAPLICCDQAVKDFSLMPVTVSNMLSISTDISVVSFLAAVGQARAAFVSLKALL